MSFLYLIEKKNHVRNPKKNTKLFRASVQLKILLSSKLFVIWSRRQLNPLPLLPHKRHSRVHFNPLRRDKLRVIIMYALAPGASAAMHVSIH